MPIKSDYPDVEIDERQFAIQFMERVELHALNAQKVAIIDADNLNNPLTYRNLRLYIVALADFLHEHDFGHKSVASIIAPNCSQFAIAFGAVMLCGGATSGVSCMFLEEEICTQLLDCGASVVFCHENLLEKTRKAARQCPKFQILIVITDTPKQIDLEENEYLLCNLFKRNTTMKNLITNVNVKKEPILIPYSSGTTGLSKGVIISHYNLSTVCASYEYMMKKVIWPRGCKNYVPENETIILFLPLYHVYGIFMLLQCLMDGTQLVLMKQFNGDLFCSLVQKFKPKMQNLVPPLVNFLASHPLVDKYDMSSITLIISAAAPLSPELIKKVKQRFRNIRYVSQAYVLSKMPKPTKQEKEEADRLLKEYVNTLSDADKQKVGGIKSARAAFLRIECVDLIDPDAKGSEGKNSQCKICSLKHQAFKRQINKQEVSYRFEGQRVVSHLWNSCNADGLNNLSEAASMNRGAFNRDGNFDRKKKAAAEELLEELSVNEFTCQCGEKFKLTNKIRLMTTIKSHVLSYCPFFVFWRNQLLNMKPVDGATLEDVNDCAPFGNWVDVDKDNVYYVQLLKHELIIFPNQFIKKNLNYHGRYQPHRDSNRVYSGFDKRLRTHKADKTIDVDQEEMIPLLSSQNKDDIALIEMLAQITANIQCETKNGKLEVSPLFGRSQEDIEKAFRSLSHVWRSLYAQKIKELETESPGQLQRNIQQYKEDLKREQDEQKLLIDELLTESEVAVDSPVSMMQIEERPDITYADVGGCKEQIKKLREILEMPLLHPERYINLGIEPPKGVLLYGPSGTGKTLCARAVANRTDACFIHVIGSEFVQKSGDEGVRMVREIFKLARTKKACIIFFDEIDTIGSVQVDDGMDGDNEIQCTMIELLTQLDKLNQ